MASFLARINFRPSILCPCVCKLLHEQSYNWSQKSFRWQPIAWLTFTGPHLAGPRVNLSLKMHPSWYASVWQMYFAEGGQKVPPKSLFPSPGAIIVQLCHGNPLKLIYWVFPVKINFKFTCHGALNLLRIFNYDFFTLVPSMHMKLLLAPLILPKFLPKGDHGNPVSVRMASKSCYFKF